MFANQQQDPAAPKDDTPWYLKWGGKGVATVASIVAMITGVMAVITISPTCIVFAIYQILAGFFMALIEAPYLCFFVDFVQKVSSVMDGRPSWNKAVLYIAMSLPPVIFCGSLSNILGCGMIFFAGVVYGFLALGKKGSREDMMAAAAANQQKSPGIEDQDAWGP
ncbi:unnamed protein product [Notodromas monacha]|uniref:Calcium channel flower n=1 Tax=Notodromas monacha TaxID=399045 RepID=A0A7R9BBX2_9CRUS|nr:unnamed protein product [Notodromas monacha]CAG0912420.1 unnamed protein product [Notodromas monacha]